MYDLVTVGETMAAFVPERSGALRYVADYNMRIAGAESNLAIGMAKLGVQVGWISRLGDDEFGHFIRNSIRGEGVDTSGVLFDQDHSTGIMFKESGAGETKVYYYRRHSAASFLCPQDISAEMLSDTKILHLTGITPVLSDSCREMVLHTLALARERHLSVSFDPNIRRKLWGETDYTPLLREIAMSAQIVMLGLDEAETLFGTREQKSIADYLLKEGKAEYVAVKDGGNGSYVADGAHRDFIPPYPCRCIEPIGAGDAFNAGFLTGILKGNDVITCGRMGNIAGALATESPGDIEGYPSLAQMNRILAGNADIYR